MWFLLSLSCMLFWGGADLFYKKGTDSRDRYSHLKIAVWVGFVMGVFAFILMPFAETKFSVSALIQNAIKYSPASLGYIISMIVGYAGLRYLEVSVVSPVQNASGAFSALAMFIWFSAKGKADEFFGDFWYLNAAGTLLIVAGVIALGVVEQRLCAKEGDLAPGDKKYRFGALALIFPVLYCVFDTVGTAADGRAARHDPDAVSNRKAARRDGVLVKEGEYTVRHIHGLSETETTEYYFPDPGIDHPLPVFLLSDTNLSDLQLGQDIIESFEFVVHLARNVQFVQYPAHQLQGRRSGRGRARPAVRRGRRSCQNTPGRRRASPSRSASRRYC